MQSPAAYTPRADVRDDPVDGDEAAVVEGHARPPRGRGRRCWAPSRARGCSASPATVRPSVRVTVTDVAVAGHRLHPRLGRAPSCRAGSSTSSSTADASASSPGSTRSRERDQRDVDAEREVGAGELRAGDARADHDQLRRHLGRGRRPAPRSGSARRRAGRSAGCAGRRRWRRAPRRPRASPRPSASVATTRSGPSRRPRPRTTRTPSFSSRARDVGGLVGRELLDPGVDPGQVDPDGRRRVALVVVEVDARARAALGDVGHQLGGGDQGLAGHAVGEHRRAADAVGVDDGDLGAELGGDQGGLVAARAAADDDDVVIGCIRS